MGHEPVTFNNSLDCPAVEDVLSEGESSSLWLIKVPHNVSLPQKEIASLMCRGSI